MAGKLAGKVAIITGAGNGIGRASALHFAAAGAHVVVNDIDADSAAETVALIEREGGLAQAQVADVTLEKTWPALIAAATAVNGQLDILFSNAGGAMPTAATEQSGEDYRRIMALNFDAVYYGCMAALKVMLEQRRGCLLSTSSGAGHAAVSGLAVYGAAKAAVINLMRNLAIEYGHMGIRANAISPGAIATPGLLGVVEGLPGGGKAYSRQIPSNRLGTPDDIARAALFLVSDDADYINGTVLPVDGGTHAKLAVPDLRE